MGIFPSNPDKYELSQDRRRELLRLEGHLGYGFKDPRWLDQALIHSSYAYECPELEFSNERLEFLGDAVLALVISDQLMEQFPQASEGELSRWRASLVNARQLAALAKKLNLGDYLLLGRGEEQQAGRKKPSVLADALEAVLGAIYRDGGLTAVQTVISHLFSEYLAQAGHDRLFKDFKTVLQEYTQKYFQLAPTYQVCKEIGPAHAKTFEVEVWLENRCLARGEGNTKKQAAQSAARRGLEYLKSLEENQV